MTRLYRCWRFGDSGQPYGHNENDLGNAGMIVTVVGLSAGFCTTVSFLPQVLKTWRTRSTADISLGMFLVFTIGCTLWLLYGILQRDIAIILPNTLTIVLSTIILACKFRYG
jgi:MtN3 and saliva related transmembrane protein